MAEVLTEAAVGVPAGEVAVGAGLVAVGDAEEPAVGEAVVAEGEVATGTPAEAGEVVTDGVGFAVAVSSLPPLATAVTVRTPATTTTAPVTARIFARRPNRGVPPPAPSAGPFPTAPVPAGTGARGTIFRSGMGPGVCRGPAAEVAGWSAGPPGTGFPGFAASDSAVACAPFTAAVFRAGAA